MSRVKIMNSSSSNKRVLDGFILPFPRAHPVIICQGYNGPHGHYAYSNGNLFADDTYSLDFALPLKTRVLAAKSGKVKTLFGGMREYYCGLDEAIGISMVPNLIVLEHEDKTQTLYGHLDHGSIRVSIGNHVKQGDFIARTGLSGWVGDIPNLHFEVFENSYMKDHFSRISLPVIFKDYSGELWHSKLHH